MIAKKIKKGKLRDTILEKLVKANRYSEYMDFGDFSGQDRAVLQAVVLCNLGNVVQTETGEDMEKIIGMFEKTFEHKPAKIIPAKYKMVNGEKIRVVEWKPVGITTKQIADDCFDICEKPSTHELGPVMRELDKNHLVERRMVANYWIYIANGYKHLLRNNLINI